MSPTLVNVHRSSEDASINYLLAGALEARFVQREADQVIVYLSSQYGCDQACRFCHLTQQKQTDTQYATVAQFVRQAELVLEDYFTRTLTIPQRINFNYMARGEVLMNLTHNPEHRNLHRSLEQVVSHVFLEMASKLNVPMPTLNHYISTIFPTEVVDHLYAENLKLKDILPDPNFNTVFWSLYSLDDAFRRRWLPKAARPEVVAPLLLEWQNRRGDDGLVLHHALIEGENDSIKATEDIIEFMEDYELSYRINLVRYNPYSKNQGQETSEAQLERIAATYRSAIGDELVQIVPRVGPDVAAACGMFLPK